jgi:hypothetical protein
MGRIVIDFDLLGKGELIWGSIRAKRNCGGGNDVRVMRYGRTMSWL